MKTSRGRVATLTILAALLFAGCGEAVVGSQHGPTLRGAFLDAETGDPVLRSTINAHFFVDAIDFQYSLDHVERSTYAVRVPGGTVRVRVFDSDGRYELYEETFTFPVEGDTAGRDIDIPLQPTHYVRLFGKVTDLNTEEPVSWRGDGTIGSAPILTFTAASGERGEGGGRLTTGENGTYSVRVPRTKLAVQTLDTPLSPQVPELDLTDFEPDELEFDVDLK